MLGALAQFVFAPLTSAFVAAIIVHVMARRRDLENERRKQRLDYLVRAYRSLERAAHRDLTGDVGLNFEVAIADIILLGTPSQISLARTLILSLSANGSSTMDQLLVSLRQDLRQELGLTADALRSVPNIRVGARNVADQTPLRLNEPVIIDFETLSKRTRVAAIQANDKQVQTRSKIEVPRLAPEIADLVERAPAAAVTRAYQEVLDTLISFARAAGTEPEGDNLSTLSQKMASADLITSELATTLDGLHLMATISRSGGSGTGLSPKQAREYLDLAAVALFVLRGISRR